MNVAFVAIDVLLCCAVVWLLFSIKELDSVMSGNLWDEHNQMIDLLERVNAIEEKLAALEINTSSDEKVDEYIKMQIENEKLFNEGLANLLNYDGKAKEDKK